LLLVYVDAKGNIESYEHPLSDYGRHDISGSVLHSVKPLEPLRSTG
jgi:hypothetical protein